MTSPYTGIAENGTVTFSVPTGATTTDRNGNPVAVTEQLTVVCKVKQRSMRQQDLPGSNPDQIRVEVICINPMVLDSRVQGGAIADIAFDQLTGKLTLDPLINPPHGREGIGKILEQEAGTMLTGIMQITKRGN